jgi:MerR family copper efflux transcriptional regulator
MRITEAATRLGTSPRMLRYRDLLGLLPPVREAAHKLAREPGIGGTRIRGTRAANGSTRRAGTRSAPRRGAPSHRHFDEGDLDAVAMALDLERRYDVSPAAVAFGMRVLTEPGLRAELAELGRRIGRIPPPPARALEFEKERALRLLSLKPKA